MHRRSWFYIVLGIIAVLTAGAVTNQVVPLAPAANSGVSLHETGVGFPDGTLQTTAFQGMFGAPEEVFREECAVTKSTATSIGRCELSTAIPAGKRLVIETVSGVGYADNYVLGSAYLGVNRVRYGFPWLQQTNSVASRRFFGFNHAVRIYADGPTTLQFDAYGGSSSGTSNYSLTYAVSGYLVDLPS